MIYGSGSLVEHRALPNWSNRIAVRNGVALDVGVSRRVCVLWTLRRVRIGHTVFMDAQSIKEALFFVESTM